MLLIRNLVAAGAALLALAAPSAHAQAEAALAAPVFDAEATALAAISAAEAEHLFVFDGSAARDGHFTGVRHSASGLLCGWGPRDTIALLIFAADGEDVGCSIASAFGVHTLYATRHTPAPRLEDALAGAAAAIVTRYPDARPIETPPHRAAAWRSYAAPENASAYFEITGADGEPLVMAVSVAQIGGWTYKLRYTGQAEFAAYADMVWAVSLGAIVGAHDAERFARAASSAHASRID
ncbi:MAG: hypothetical protein GC189_12495 [Alphaproteobacteria bacterium]|nr:hypothetical protein [Alphaproteobacteria bacterium]